MRGNGYFFDGWHKMLLEIHSFHLDLARILSNFRSPSLNMSFISLCMAAHSNRSLLSREQSVILIMSYIQSEFSWLYVDRLSGYDFHYFFPLAQYGQAPKAYQLQWFGGMFTEKDLKLTQCVFPSGSLHQLGENEPFSLYLPCGLFLQGYFLNSLQNKVFDRGIFI